MPGPNYYYLRDGERAGPIPFEELRALADSGRLTPADVVWREGTPDWAPASTVEGLFDAEAVVAEAVVENPADGARASFAPPPPGTASDWREQWNRLQPIVQRYSDRFAVSPLTFLAALAGAAALVLLLLATLLVWDTAFYDARLFGDAFDGGDATRGIGVLEGKLVFLFVLGSLALLAVSVILKRFLPIGLLAAGAAGTASFFLIWIRRGHVVRAMAAEIAGARQGDVFFGEGGNPAGIDVSGGTTFALYFAWFLALVAAAAFIFAALCRPQELSRLQQAGGGPLVQKYGLLIGVQAVAFLFGVAMYVIRY